MKGLWTALVTPFKEGNGIDNEIDYDGLKELLNIQIEGGVDGVLLLGTTAENPTLTKQEGLELVKFAIKILKGKTKIMVNVGTYSTQASLENIKEYDKIEGIDAYLVVNPYYNKPTQTGLFKHFTTIANSTSRNIILYNIQGRTGVNLETNTLLEILDNTKNVIGVKEASELNNIYSELFSKLFIQANPLPAKTYLAFNGIIKEEFRLPMCRMDEKEKQEFLDFIKKFED